ncbi:hypothetical protein ACHAWF_007625 [Thalassiosira exigua]
MFAELKRYKSTHGDTLVPATYPANPSLSTWVDNTRQWYRIRMEAEKFDIMTDEKIEQLNAIGFVWNQFDHNWNVRYEELKEYIAEHGNALVPHPYSRNQSLSHWVDRQRRLYKRRQEESDPYHKEEILKSGRIEKLNEIGFTWDALEAQWLECFEDMKRYKKNNGDTLVSKVCADHPFLGGWVDRQRLDYRRYMARKMIETGCGYDDLDDRGKAEIEKMSKKSTGMTEERIQLLESEGFIWEPSVYKWELKFSELCEFAALNGHAAPKRSRRNYNSLASWVETQRSNYWKFVSGQKSSMTEERIARLNAINFEWANPITTKGARKKLSPRKQPFDKKSEKN